MQHLTFNYYNFTVIGYITYRGTDTAISVAECIYKTVLHSCKIVFLRSGNILFQSMIKVSTYAKTNYYKANYYTL